VNAAPIPRGITEKSNSTMWLSHQITTLLEHWLHFWQSVQPFFWIAEPVRAAKASR